MPTVAEQIKALIEEYSDNLGDYNLDMVVAEIREIATKEMREALKAIQKFTAENFAIGSVPQQVICGKCFLALAKVETK